VARKLRIAFGRIAQETNALSPLRTTIDDFRAQHWIEGDELLARCRTFGNEAPGFLPWAELSGFVRAARSAGDVEAVPLSSAWAVPSGPLERSCFEELTMQLADRLERARPLDGVFLSLHGAMGVVGMQDPEAEIVNVARIASGGAKVAISLDLHANLARPIVEASDAIVAYATNPHRDHFSTGRRAGSILVRALRGEIEPVTAWRSLPLLLGGGAGVDVLSPMRAIFRRARQMERERGVLSTSLFLCHPWNDAPELGWSTLAIADRDRAIAEACAEELAERCWSVKDVQPPRFPSAREAIRIAKESGLARKLGVVVMSDASDVVAAGAPGDSTHLVRALLEEGEGLVSYASIRDPAVARSLEGERDGDEVHVRVGGALDPSRSEPLEVDAVVRRVQRDPGFGIRVLLDLDPPPHVARGTAGTVRLVVTEGPPLAMSPGFYTSMGLSIRKADVVVVKSFFPFRLFFLPWARKTIYVKTRGATDLDAAFALAQGSPVHPRDRVDGWRDTDRRRRAL
jgi:microcystin degradation protein MlrC